MPPHVIDCMSDKTHSHEAEILKLIKGRIWSLPPRILVHQGTWCFPFPPCLEDYPGSYHFGKNYISGVCKIGSLNRFGASRFYTSGGSTCTRSYSLGYSFIPHLYFVGHYSTRCECNTPKLSPHLGIGISHNSALSSASC